MVVDRGRIPIGMNLLCAVLARLGLSQALSASDVGEMARPERFERPTPRFVVWCSIQLSYGRLRAIRAGGPGRPNRPGTGL